MKIMNKWEKIKEIYQIMKMKFKNQKKNYKI